MREHALRRLPVVHQDVLVVGGQHR
ncbi:hypothetical protein ACLIYP_07795 [Streptomyces nanhaiensis]